MKVSKKDMEDAYKLFFGTLTSKARLNIINSLRKGPKTVSELQKGLKLEQTSASHNLKRLKSCGFANVEKKGKFRVYPINKKTIAPLMALIDTHMSNHCIKIIKSKKGGR